VGFRDDYPVERIAAKPENTPRACKKAALFPRGF
jgi:hypothetical protein